MYCLVKSKMLFLRDNLRKTHGIIELNACDRIKFRLCFFFGAWYFFHKNLFRYLVCDGIFVGPYIFFIRHAYMNSEDV